MEYVEESGATVTVEVFPRADESTHITASSDIVALPLDPAAVIPDASAINCLQVISERLSPIFRLEGIVAAPSLLPSGHARWPAADREGAAHRGRLRGHRT